MGGHKYVVESSIGSIRMIIIRQLFSVLLVLFCANFAIRTQSVSNDGLAVSGLVQSIMTVDTENRRRYKIVFRLQLRNDSNGPLIMLELAPMNRKVDFLYKSLGDSKRAPDEAEQVVEKFSLPPALDEFYKSNNYNDEYDWVGGYFGEFAWAETPIRHAIVLEPGQTRDVIDSIKIEQQYKIVWDGSKKKRYWEGFSDGKPEGIPISKPPAFTIEYHLAVPSSFKDPDLLVSLKHRWQKYGDLVLDREGGFTIKSERILNIGGKQSKP
jgi:hypothetical protein